MVVVVGELCGLPTVLRKLGLIPLTVGAMVMLYAAIHSGLLLQPDMQVSGNGSWNGHLAWYVDRIDSTMPQPTVLSLPMWTWRVLMLLWSLWLAASLVKWLPWAWDAFSEDGFYRKMQVLSVKKRKRTGSGEEVTEVTAVPEGPTE